LDCIFDAFERTLATKVPEAYCEFIHALQQCKLFLQREGVVRLQVTFELREYVRLSNQGLPMTL
jgi:hypothetical protein